jgi:spermidine synthase
MRPWLTLEKVSTPAGPLELRQRGDRDFLIMIDGRVLMTSAAHRSEDALAQRACEALAGNLKPRILLGGLGMGVRKSVRAVERLRIGRPNAVLVPWSGTSSSAPESDR